MMQIPELDFEIPTEAQRGSLSTVCPLIPTHYLIYLFSFLLGSKCLCVGIVKAASEFLSSGKGITLYSCHYSKYNANMEKYI